MSPTDNRKKSVFASFLRSTRLQGVEKAQELASQCVAKHGPALGVDKDQERLGTGGHAFNAIVLPLQL